MTGRSETTPILRAGETARVNQSWSWLAALQATALFASAFVLNRRLSGSSPMAWIDTFNDQGLVERCLRQDDCTLLGVQTSIRGVFHAVSWLDLRTLFEWSGGTLDGVLLFVQVLNALLLLLVFVLATKLGGTLAGVLAGAILMFGIGDLGVPPAAMHNLSIAPFLGGVFVIACTAAIDRPGILTIALASAVGAVLANVHVVCILAGVSVVWVALLAPRRRVVLVALAAALFLMATVAIAPSTWRHNLLYLLQPRTGSGEVSLAPWSQFNEILSWTALAVVAWIGSLASRTRRWAEYRRRSQGTFAVVTPLLVACLVAPHFGVLVTPKYLSPIKAAVAIAAALPLAMIATTGLRAGLPQTVVRSSLQILPFALALAVITAGGRSHDERTTTVADIAAVAHILHDERGWTAQEVAERFGTPDHAAILAGLLQLYPQGTQAADGNAVGETAQLIAINDRDVSDPMPSSWRRLRRSPQAPTVLIFNTPCLDRSAFEVCSRAEDSSEQTCSEGRWQLGSDQVAITVSGMPPAGVLWRGTLTLRYRLRPESDSAIRAVFMPRTPGVCGGRIASVIGAPAEISADQRHATIPQSTSPGARVPTIELEWRIGQPECDVGAYDGLPPFIVEGDAGHVERLETALRTAEAQT